MRAKVRPTKFASVGALIIALVWALIGISLMSSGTAFGALLLVVALGIGVYHVANLNAADIPAGEEVIFEQAPGPASGPAPLQERLAQLDALHADDVITYEEYALQRRRILETR